MTRADRDGFDLGIFAALIALGFVLALLTGARPGSGFDSTLPRCPEDSVLVGTGAFEDGHWTTYACGPAFDDYQQEDRS